MAHHILGILIFSALVILLGGSILSRETLLELYRSFAIIFWHQMCMQHKQV